MQCLAKIQIMEPQVPTPTCFCNKFEADKAVQGNWLQILKF